MPQAMQSALYRTANTPYKNGVFLPLVLDIGASGAPTINTASASGFTIARSGAGTYNGVAPTGARGCVAGYNIVSNAAEAGLMVKFRTYVSTSGVFTFDTYDTDANDVADDIPSGSQIHILFFVEGG